MNVPENLLYTESHEWIDTASEAAAVGISDHAQEELTDVVFVELPEVGRQVAAGEAVAVVESVKAANDIYTPVSGEIMEVNAALQDDPSLVNSDAYGAGWMFKVKLSEPSELDKLLGPEEYRAHIG